MFLTAITICNKDQNFNFECALQPAKKPFWTQRNDGLSFQTDSRCLRRWTASGKLLQSEEVGDSEIGKQRSRTKPLNRTPKLARRTIASLTPAAEPRNTPTHLHVFAQVFPSAISTIGRGHCAKCYLATSLPDMQNLNKLS